MFFMLLLFIWLDYISVQFQSLPGDEFRARRSCGGRGKRGWRSFRMSSWWTESWSCHSRASITSTPRRTSGTPTPWRRRRRAERRQRTGGSPCYSTFIKRWGSVSLVTSSSFGCMWPIWCHFVLFLLTQHSCCVAFEAMFKSTKRDSAASCDLMPQAPLLEPNSACLGHFISSVRALSSADWSFSSVRLELWYFWVPACQICWLMWGQTVNMCSYTTSPTAGPF